MSQSKQLTVNHQSQYLPLGVAAISLHHACQFPLLCLLAVCSTDSFLLQGNVEHLSDQLARTSDAVVCGRIFVARAIVIPIEF